MHAAGTCLDLGDSLAYVIAVLTCNQQYSWPAAGLC